MTADAKVGLLLGLVFIVLIAFLINGLPGFLNPPSKLNVMPEDQKPNTIITIQAEKVVEAMTPPSTIRDSAPPKEERANVTVRNDKPIIQESAPQPKAAETVIPVSTGDTDKAAAPKPIEIKTVEPQAVKPPVELRTYVVQPGDNLSKIAVAMYGSELGNKLATVQALYEANKDKMKTASDILPGKKLVIPDLAPVTPVTAGSVSTPTKPVEKTADKPSTKPADKATTTTKTPAGKTEKPKPTNPDPDSFEQPKKKPISATDAGKSYRVKSGESLWTIAQKQLGNGNRYREIIALNSQVLRKPDDVRAQMTLKLPKR